MVLDEFLDDWAPIPEKRIDFLTALRDNRPADLTALYWLARITLVMRLEDLPRFDAVFAAHFTGAAPAAEPSEEGESEAPQPQREGTLEPLQLAEGTGRDASVDELQHHRAYEPGADDLAELRRALAQHLPRVRSRRRRPARRGAHIDLRRTLRAATRTGEIVHLARRDRPHRRRPLLLLIDVSGSLREHTPDYLRFAWAAQAETFTFGTRLTRITKQLRERDVERALANVSEVVEDADGGTLIGPALQEFLDTPRYADRARGALTIVLSDGLERGDPALMVHAVRRLARLSHRLLWWTPLALDPAYRPVTRGMAAIVDDLDGLAGARDIPSLLAQVKQL
ncbi:MAG TPA: VWA domain-containing protein [Solirubrobacter sp.]|nr:VWA domain-containing protein [Solirubrobacter sp.]